MTTKLKRESAGHYVTPDGRYTVEFEEWWLEGACECLMCQQGSECPRGGDGLRSGWTIFDTVSGDHLTGEPYQFETFRDAHQYLAAHLADAR